MPTVHHKRSKISEPFWTLQTYGSVEQFEPGQSIFELVEPLPDGRFHPWNVKTCRKYPSEPEAAAVLADMVGGTIVHDATDTSKFAVELDMIEITEVVLSVTPVTLTPDEIQVGRANAILHRLPKETWSDDAFRTQVDLLPVLGALTADDVLPNSDIMNTDLFVYGFVDSWSDSLISKGFEMATGGYLKNFVFTVQHPMVATMLEKCEFGKISMFRPEDRFDQVIRKHDPSSEYLWNSMLSIYTTPLRLMTVYSKPDEKSKKYRHRDRLDDQGRESFLARFSPSQQAIMRQAFAVDPRSIEWR